MGKAVKGTLKVKKDIISTSKLKNSAINKNTKKTQSGLKTFVKNLKENTKGPIRAADVLNNVEAIIPEASKNTVKLLETIAKKQTTEKPEKRISKKEKIRNRHLNFKKKIEEIQKANEETIKRKKREKTKIVGDLQPLKDSLASVESLLKYKEKGIQKTGVPQFDKQIAQSTTQKPESNKFKNKKKTDYGDRLKYFNLLITDTHFKNNPRQVITEHVRNTRLMEEAAETGATT